jgi:hypothetical protein
VVLQIILVFAMIGVLGLLLRWAFSRDKQAPQWPASAASPADSPASPPASAETKPASAEAQPASAEAQPASAEAQPGAAAAAPFVADAGSAPTAADVEREDYGLLAEVAIAASAQEGERIKARLGAVGIRATTTVGRDGRHRVLVFASEIHRARRVAGGS